MPWTDPHGLTHMFESLMGLFGFPFMLQEGQEQPRMNKSRFTEAVLIALVTALLSAGAAAALNLLYVLPELDKKSALLAQTVESHSTDMLRHEIVAERRRSQDREECEANLAEHAAQDTQHRNEDRLQMHENLDVISAALLEIKTEVKRGFDKVDRKMEKYDNDFYTPKSGH